MKRASLIFAVAVVGSAIDGGAAAQDSSGVLNTLDVQRLVMTNTPAAHFRLAKHFMALADQYAANAARVNVSARLSGNPNHPSSASGGQRRRDESAAEASLSESARQMAAYHQFLSIGFPATVPDDRTGFDSGFGARIPTTSELARALAEARTSSDHHELQEFFLVRADRDEAAAARHTAVARSLRAGVPRGAESAAAHREWRAREARRMAKEARSAAEFQRQLAELAPDRR